MLTRRRLHAVKLPPWPSRFQRHSSSPDPGTSRAPASRWATARAPRCTSPPSRRRPRSCASRSCGGQNASSPGARPAASPTRSSAASSCAPTGIPLGELRTRGVTRHHVAFAPPWGAVRACVHIEGGEVRDRSPRRASRPAPRRPPPGRPAARARRRAVLRARARPRGLLGRPGAVRLRHHRRAATRAPRSGSRRAACVAVVVRRPLRGRRGADARGAGGAAGRARLRRRRSTSTAAARRRWSAAGGCATGRAPGWTGRSRVGAPCRRRCCSCRARRRGPARSRAARRRGRARPGASCGAIEKRSSSSTSSSRRMPWQSSPGATSTCGRERREARGHLPHVQVVDLDHARMPRQRAADRVGVEAARRALEQHQAALAQQAPGRPQHQGRDEQRGDRVGLAEAGREDDRARERRAQRRVEVGHHVRAGALDVERAALRPRQRPRRAEVDRRPEQAHHDHDPALDVGRVAEPAARPRRRSRRPARAAPRR